jgi:MFS family permease
MLSIIKQKQKSIIGNKDFLLLLSSQIISNIGTSIHYSAIIWFIMSIIDKNKTGMYIGLFTSSTLIVNIITGPFAGVLVDKFCRKKIIICTNMIRGFLVLTLAIIQYLDELSICIIILVACLCALVGAFFGPAVSASIPNIVKSENLTKANALNSISSQITTILGAAISGVLYYFIGIVGIFIIDGLSYIIAGMLNVIMSIDEDKEKINLSNKTLRFLADFKQGIHFIKSQKIILILFGFAVIINFLCAPTFQILVPKIVRYTLQMGAREYGIVAAMFPIGAIFTLSILSMLPEMNKVRKVIAYGIVFDGFLFSLVGILLIMNIFVLHVNITLTLILLCMIFIGLGIVNTLVSVPTTVIFQKKVPNEYRGRFFGLLTTLTQGLIPIGLAIIGTISDFVSPVYIFLGSGTIVFFLGVWIYFVPELKEF